MIRAASCALHVALALGACLGTVVGQVAWRPAPQFSDRNAAGIAYDPVRERVVLFGGSFASWMAHGTWEWDGRAWSLKRPLHSPKARRGHRMAWDPNLKQILMFGGVTGDPDGPNRSTTYLNETWTWDGQDWRQLFPKNAPGARTSFGLATDPNRRRIVIFGGLQGWDQPLDDTWEWDGADWTQIVPKTQKPPPRGAAGFAYNPQTRRMTLMGGTTGGPAVPPNDCWEWDGSDWHRFAVPASFYPVIAHCATDPFTSEVFMWADVDILTMPQYPSATFWRWNGQQWRRVVTPTDVGNRGGEIAADPAHRQIVAVPWGVLDSLGRPRQDCLVFDGSDWKKAWQQTWPNATRSRSAYDSLRQDVVTWVGETYQDPPQMWLYRLEEGWRRQAVVNMPEARWVPTLVSMGRGGSVVLFGGYRSDQYGLSGHEVFEWTGSDWRKSTFATAPLYATGPATVDPERKKVILGGRFGVNELWELDLQQGWRQIQQGPRPPDRDGTAICFDPARKRLVLFGGSDRQSGLDLNDTWEWDGATWTQRFPSRSPPVRFAHRLAHVPALGGVVLAGGYATMAQECFGDTWVWDGTSWTEIGTSSLPRPTDFAQWPDFAFDCDRQRLFAIYGLGHAGPGPAAEIWYLEPDRLSASQPLPRPGQTFSLDLTVPSSAGSWSVVALSLGSYPGIPLPPAAGPFRVLPMAPDALLLWSLGLGLVTRLDAAGRGSVPFGIPNDAGLIGLRFETAGLLLDSQLRIADATNAVTVEVVR